MSDKIQLLLASIIMGTGVYRFAKDGVAPIVKKLTKKNAVSSRE